MKLVKLETFLRTPILKKICEQMLLSCARMWLPISDSASITSDLNCGVDGKDTIKNARSLFRTISEQCQIISI